MRGHLTALRNLRHGFIEQHGSEPSVSLRYSQQSTSNSTISLRVGNEIDRANYVEEGAQATQSSSSADKHDRNPDEVNFIFFVELLNILMYTLKLITGFFCLKLIVKVSFIREGFFL